MGLTLGVQVLLTTTILVEKIVKVTSVQVILTITNLVMKIVKVT